MDPFRNGEAYESAKLGGVQLPGKVVVQGLASPRKWDDQAGPGTSGATSKYAGPGIAEFTIQVQMWEPAQFDAFERDVRPIIAEPLPNVRPSALDFEHPDAAKLGIKRCVVTNVSQTQVFDEGGLFGFTISMKQFRPPKPVQVLKAKGDDPNNPNKSNSGADDPKSAFIRDLTKQFQAEASK